ncbi:MAG: aryl-sulfate sulfotransferase [Planctomycetota bacterium]|jgi:hypothetical protein|nr:aryl-sulfate sulfotransferase [Planctomycetota bacterium]
MRTLPLAALTLLLACSPSCSRSEGVTQTLLPPPSRDGWLSETPFPGYNLISPLKSTDVFLVNLEGEVVHRWETKVEPGNSVYLTDRGTLYRCERIEDNKPFRGGGIGGAIQEIDADGTILWDYRFADDTRHAHHDIEIMPNGNILILAWVMHTREEALANGRDPELLRGEMFWPDSIFEIKPLPNNDAEIVWEWHSWDHLIQDFDKDANFFGVVSEHPERIDINGDRDPELMSEEEQDAEFEHLQALGYAGGAKEESDGKPPVKRPDRPPPKNGDEKRDDRDRRKTRDADWMHTNGIDYNAELDQIVISVRRFDEAWVIDHSTTTTEAASSEGGRYGRGGDLLYRWGNPSAYGMGSAEDRVLVVQHDVQWIEGGRLGAGGFLAFNNGRGRLGGDYSTIEEWWPPINEAGEYVIEAGTPFAPTQSSWTYMADTPSDFYSSFISGVQRLPNGNTLICSGEKGNVFEINSAGKTVWQWDCDLVPNEKPEESKEKKRGIRKNALFRVTRIAPDHAGLEALRAKGLEIPRSVAMPIAH